ncbi:MAG: HD family phosphohydrolase [Microcystaceae cyanobacterium]
MNTFNKLTRTLKQWHKDTQEQGIMTCLCQHQTFKTLQNTSFKIASDLNRKIFSSKSSYTIHPPLMFGIAVLSLTGIVGYRYYNQPQLAVGTVAPETIFAPKDGSFEDPKTTEKKRKAAETSIIPLLKRDPNKTIQLRVQVSQTLEEIQKLRNSAGAFPSLPTDFLSIEAQRYLRNTSEEEWEIIQSYLVKTEEEETDEDKQPLIPLAGLIITQLRQQQEQMPAEDFEKQLKVINRMRQKYQLFKETLPSAAVTELSELQVLQFVNLPEEEWQFTKQQTSEGVHRILTQGIYPGFSEFLLKETIKTNFSQPLPAPIQGTIPTLLFKILDGQANLVIDEEATLREAKEASAAVKTALVEIKANEVIVRAGEKIDQESFVILDGFGLSQRSVNWSGLGTSAILVTGGVLIFCLIARRTRISLRRRDHILLLLLSVASPALGMVDAKYLNLPMVGTLTSSFYSPTLAMTQVVVLGGLSAFADDPPQWDYLLAGTAGGLLAAAVAGRLRSRDELAFLGAGVGLTQGSLYLLYHLAMNAASGGIGYPLWYLLLPKALLFGVSGMVWTIIAIGLSPYLERLFDLVTPIRLVELSNPNCTLLKRLQTEAPGTFQHTLFVACLAEAAARELNCNVELVRAGTLYHDIGKMHDPMGFIENQMGGPNKHDDIDNPWVSVDLIKKHVSEGIVMAKQYGLPKMIQAFIPEHQGKLLISYFYYQAKQQADEQGKDPIQEEDFRYIGPIPQSRETGIVMLADGCEAALRSLQDATPEDALALIKKIFKARWRDGQLEDSGLKFEELPMIADIFVRVWQQFHHKRIAYPKAALEIKG